MTYKKLLLKEKTQKQDFKHLFKTTMVFKVYKKKLKKNKINKIV